MTDDTTADPHLAAAGETLRHLNELGANGYGPNAPALIAEAMLEVALAEAITNRLRLLREYERSVDDESLALALGWEEATLLATIVDVDRADETLHKLSATEPKETP